MKISVFTVMTSVVFDDELNIFLTMVEGRIIFSVK